MTSTRFAERFRRVGVVGSAAIAGILLLITGFALTALESQMRIDAATAAVTLTPAQLEQLSEAGVDDVGQDSYRDWLIVAGLTSGARVPTLVLEVTDTDDGVSWSWQAGEPSVVASWGGWQAKPLAGLTVAGLALVLGSLFLAAWRWTPTASVPVKLTDAVRPGQTG